jgi:two-component system, NarL family, nitrate/nitrite response regulator NarL
MSPKNPRIRIVIADDHTIFRDGLKTLLAGQGELHVVGEACDGEEALKLVEKLHPDILLLDMSMPRVSGMDVLQALADSSNQNKTLTILLSAALEGEEITRAFELGARGIVLKDSATQMLFKSIAAVMAGEYWIGRQSFADCIEALKQHRHAAKKTPKNFGITAREMEVLDKAVFGLSNKEIAAQFAISEQTVKHHITSIFDKLGVYNRLELTLFALHHKLVQK